MKCQTLASTCNGTDVQPVLLYLRRTPRPLCAGCRAALEAKGASFQIERRAADRPFRPRWLEHLTARDMTDRSVA